MREYEFNTEGRQLLLIATIVLFLSQLSAEEKRYDGDEVLEVTMDDSYDSLSPMVDAMRELGPEIEIWQQPTTMSAHVYVPRLLTSSFRRRLDNIGATYRPLVTDVQRLIDEERESNVVSETEKGSRGYREHSAYQSRCTNIVDVYPTYDQLIEWLICSCRQHASVCTLDRIGSTFENRHIYVVKIFDSSTADARRPAIWIDTGIHAREWISVTTAVYFIDLLLTSFSSQTGDSATIRQLDWYIAPLLNPDGYAYSHHTDGNRLWRKNRMQYNESISFSTEFNETCIGVDLNRNFDFQWGTVRPNDEPCYIDYGGPWPASERETQAVTSYVLERKESIAAFVTIHSYGQMILTRWAYTDELHLLPEHNDTMELMAKMVDAIYETGSANYTFGRAPEILYEFSGGSGDWAKGVAGIRYSFEVELRDKGKRGFVLPTSYIQPVGEEAWSAIRVLAIHIVSDEKDNTATTATGISDSSRTMIATDSSPTGSRLTCLYSTCAVILLIIIIIIVVVITIVIIIIIVIVHKKAQAATNKSNATAEEDQQDLVSTYL